MNNLIENGIKEKYYWHETDITLKGSDIFTGNCLQVVIDKKVLV